MLWQASVRAQLYSDSHAFPHRLELVPDGAQIRSGQRVLMPAVFHRVQDVILVIQNGDIGPQQFSIQRSLHSLHNFCQTKEIQTVAHRTLKTALVQDGCSEA